jgi:hypothetical protein
LLLVAAVAALLLAVSWTQHRCRRVLLPQQLQQQGRL